MGFQTVDPHTEQVIGTYDYDEDTVIETKVAQAQEAFSQWRTLSISRRVDLLKPLVELMSESFVPLSRQMTLEMGKPILQSRAEIEKSISIIKYYLDNGEAFLRDDVISSDFARSYVSYQPLGPILGIMPWNFPCLQVIRFAIPTLLAGNSVIVKHAPNVQGCMDLIQQLFDELHLPPGLFQNLKMPVEKIEPLIAQPFLRGVSLTGSERAGRSVAQICGQYLKKCVLELGGSDAYLVLEDADLKLAIKCCMRSRFINNGQSCVAAKRFIVHASLVDQWESSVLKHISKMKVKDPSLEDSQLGPLARRDLLDQLSMQVQKSIKEGALLKCGGALYKNQKGYYYPPTLLSGVKPGMTCFNEEVFGPVMSLTSFETVEQGIELANNSRFGLGGAIFSKNRELAESIACHRLETGGVFVNDLYKSSPELPFGGVKSSGLGRELSFLGIKEFTNAKTIAVK